MANWYSVFAMFLAVALVVGIVYTIRNGGTQR